MQWTLMSACETGTHTCTQHDPRTMESRLKGLRRQNICECSNLTINAVCKAFWSAKCSSRGQIDRKLRMGILGQRKLIHTLQFECLLQLATHTKFTKFILWRSFVGDNSRLKGGKVDCTSKIALASIFSGKWVRLVTRHKKIVKCAQMFMWPQFWRTIHFAVKITPAHLNPGLSSNCCSEEGGGPPTCINMQDITYYKSY